MAESVVSGSLGDKELGSFVARQLPLNYHPWDSRQEFSEPLGGGSLCLSLIPLLPRHLAIRAAALGE